MKAKDLRERETGDLINLRDQLRRDVFSYRMKNFTSQLSDTSLISKNRRDIARIESILSARKAQEGSQS